MNYELYVIFANAQLAQKHEVRDTEQSWIFLIQ
jgi:hypothetical protein